MRGGLLLAGVPPVTRSNAAHLFQSRSPFLVCWWDRRFACLNQGSLQACLPLVRLVWTVAPLPVQVFFRIRLPLLPLRVCNRL